MLVLASVQQVRDARAGAEEALQRRRRAYTHIAYAAMRGRTEPEDARAKILEAAGAH